METGKHGRRLPKEPARVTDEDVQDIIALINQVDPARKVAVIRPFRYRREASRSITRLLELFVEKLRKPVMR